MTAKEMQVRYWEKELRDAERAINMSQEGGRLLDIAQTRYGNAEKMLKKLRNEETKDEIDC